MAHARQSSRPGGQVGAAQRISSRRAHRHAAEPRGSALLTPPPPASRILSYCRRTIGGGPPMIEFVLDGRSKVNTYMQLVQQVKQALRVGLLKPGDQLPKVRDAAQSLVINPNTVLKAYREL